jgi:PAS domain S-box-containing protein
MDDEKWMEKLTLANRELALQHEERGKRAAELIIANVELAYQNEEKGKRAAELIIANKELVYQTEEKGKRATELIIANTALAIENEKKERREAELVIANLELIHQNKEKEKHAARLSITNKELAFQYEERKKRAAELIIANEELAFQNQEKENRAAELIIANEELAYQNNEKEKRAAELVIANKELAFQNEEKEKRAAELIIANKELAFQNEEKEKRAAELIVANNELIKAEEQFRLVVELAPNSIVLINETGTITLVNNETEKLFGYDRNELIGNKLEMLIPERFSHSHPEHRDMFFDNPQARAMGAGRDLFAMRKDGTEIQVEIGLNPIETSKGKMVLASIIDITERKIQEAILKAHNNELGQVVYIASHDLQEPLRTVSNYIGIFQREYGNVLDDNARKYITSINGAIKRMSGLITSLLDFSKLGYNKKLTRVDCGQLVEEIIADLGTIIKTSQAVVEVKSLPSLNVYEIEIRQLFQNLITNAIKFRKKDIPPEIQVSAEQVNDKWKFAVSDKGIGIDPAYFDKVFDIFQRLHAKHEYEGSGIGLANCKKIVQLHLGEIWVESTEGEGCTFYFTIANLIL